MSVNGRGTLDPIERMTAELREAIAAERVARIDAERLVTDSRERERRLQRALSALEGGGPGRKPKPATAPKPKPTTWNVSESKRQAVLAALADFDGPVTVNQMMERVGWTHETVRKALESLRDEQRVRRAGTVKVGRSHQPATTYALMPGADDGA